MEGDTYSSKGGLNVSYSSEELFLTHDRGSHSTIYTRDKQTGQTYRGTHRNGRTKTELNVAQSLNQTLK